MTNRERTEPFETAALTSERLFRVIVFIIVKCASN